MKKINLIFAFTYLYLFAAFLCFGQDGKPTPTPDTSEDVVRISTTLIQIDVTVTDKQGKIVTGLRSEDFEIFENKEKQEITNFSFVPAGSETSKPVVKNTGENSLPTAPVKPEQVRRTIALVVDDLTLARENIYFVRKSLRKFVDEQMRDGDLVAIVRTGGGSGALQQFTFDKRLLYAAIEKIKLNPFGRGGAKIVLPPTAPLGGDGIGLRDPNKEADNFRQSVIAARTIGGLDYIVSGMKNLPGRKSIILFSEGFKIFNRDVAGPERDFRVSKALEKLFDSASRASVVVYTIDARGLEPEPDEDFDDQQDGLVYLAQQTGGLAIKDNNDFNLGIEKILDAQKGFYLIGYAPDAETVSYTHLTLPTKRIV